MPPFGLSLRTLKRRNDPLAKLWDFESGHIFRKWTISVEHFSVGFFEQKQHIHDMVFHFASRDS